MSSLKSINIIEKAVQQGTLEKSEVLFLLNLQGSELQSLYKAADTLCKKIHGREIFLRGIIEFSNYCRKNCDYCGIRADMVELERYRMSEEEILDVAKTAAQKACNTVVLQAGEDPFYSVDRICSIVSKIKENTQLAVTLSIGERSYEELLAFKKAGCDRYLLRFETSNRELFKAIHPDDDFDERVECIKNMQQLGIQTGSGFLIGLIADDLDVIAEDILFATALKLKMIGCGPFIPNPSTPLAFSETMKEVEIYFKTISILRLLNPYANIPATTAFDALVPSGRDLLLERGCNVFMPNLTPAKYRKLYQLYPNKPCVDEESDKCLSCVAARIKALGLKVV